MSARKLNQRSPAGRRSRVPSARGANQPLLCARCMDTDDRTADATCLWWRKRTSSRRWWRGRPAGLGGPPLRRRRHRLLPRPRPRPARHRPPFLWIEFDGFLKPEAGAISSPEHRFGARVRTYVLWRNQGNQAPLEIGEGGSEMTNELAYIFVFTFYFARVWLHLPISGAGSWEILYYNMSLWGTRSTCFDVHLHPRRSHAVSGWPHRRRAAPETCTLDPSLHATWWWWTPWIGGTAIVPVCAYIENEDARRH